MSRWTYTLFVLAALGAAGVPASPSLADGVRDRPIDFLAMDINADQSVSRAEWFAWFAEDIERRAGMAQAAPFGAPPSIEVSDGQGGVRRLVPRPYAIHGGGLPVEMEGSYGQDRVESPIAARQRMLRDADAAPFPDFDTYDVSGDGAIQREEVQRGAPVRHDPIPVRRSAP